MGLGLPSFSRRDAEDAENINRGIRFFLYTTLEGSPMSLAKISYSAFLMFVIAALTAQTPSESVDKYRWLEDVSGERSMAWVRAENERTAKVLEKDPRFSTFEAAALKVLESPERLPEPRLNGDDVYNLWKDAVHVRGILR